MRTTVAAMLLGLLLVPVGLAEDDLGPQELVEEAVEAAGDVAVAVGNEGSEWIPEDVRDELDPILGSDEPAEEEPAPPKEAAPGFAARVRDAFGSGGLVAGLAGLGATAAGLVGFAAVTRYISPKEALKNPQRAMLYGFIRATPGAHLKQLSEEFKMKTSSILWHIRKLESADLVHSERVNGFRVFYPTEGGIEAKRLSRAITTLHNENARRIQEAVQTKPGQSVKELSERLEIHSGTVRWHLRKLRDFGLVDELVREDGSQFFGTSLGGKAVEAAIGKPTTAPARRAGARLPVPE